MEGAGGHDQEVGIEGRELWLDFRSILKAGSMGFPDGIGAGLERKIGDKIDLESSGPSMIRRVTAALSCDRQGSKCV